MQTRAYLLIASLMILMPAASAGAEAVYTWELAPNFADLSESISDTDLIAGFGVNTNGLPLNEGINESAIAPFTFGIIDVVSEVYSWLMDTAPPGCLGMIELLPSDGFHPGLPPSCPEGGMSHLVDGVAGTACQSVLRDFGRAALVVRYGFDPPQDIGRIRVFGGNFNNRDARVFHNYDVYARTGPSPAGSEPGFNEFFQVAANVTSGSYGMVNKDFPAEGQLSVQGSMTDVFDFDGNTLIEGCSDLRIVFYCVGNADGFFIDPWQGNASEGEGYQSDCPDVEDEDTDGFKKAFEASIIKEIDVFPPGPTPFGDIDYDDDRDLIDIAAFQGCFMQDVAANGCYRFDYNEDLAIDLADLDSFAADLSGPQ